ncbi:LysM peptidoglycan-binding domain-containing protein, partial [bacterium]|nr:LysM peptidoglycan-binding domain-containing protein [bacterium]
FFLWLIMILAGILFLVPVGTIALGSVYFNQTERILPGVQVGPVKLGNVRLRDAGAQIDAFWNQAPHFVVSDGTNNWTVSPNQIGLWIDPGATAQQALSFGRDSGGLRELVLLFLTREYDVQPVVQFNQRLARDVLTDLSENIGRLPQDAQLFQNAEGRWVTSQAVQGVGIDIEAAISAIAADPLKMLQEGYLLLNTIPVPAKNSDFTAVLEKINAYYQIPLHFSAYDVIEDELISWTLPQDLLAKWVRLDHPEGEPYLQVDKSQFDAYLQQWQSTIGNREIESTDNTDSLSAFWLEGKAFNINLRHKPTTYTVQLGDNLVGIAFKVGIPYWKIQEANPGTSIIGIGPGQELTIPSKNDLLPLPVVPGKRVVISISEQHMWIYENSELRSEHVISTGIDRSPTLPGVFQIQTHEINAYASNWDLWMPHFLGIYEAVPGFMNGIHGLPLLSSGVRLWGNVLGSKASYGCIIMTLDAAEDLYHWAENGVVVEILP